VIARRKDDADALNLATARGDGVNGQLRHEDKSKILDHGKMTGRAFEKSK
jgi:hypothetical protein